mmetsp:Transcript_74246/g.215133  ORF Transcript_74246/g.215133 Transcript_74246/m.215133 type:complete len:201 (+) Transcript_74246:1597-2199(+)
MVRSDIVQAFEEEHSRRQVDWTNVSLVNRPIDVIHHWPVPLKRQIGNPEASQRNLRNQVSYTLHKFRKSHPIYQIQCGLQGSVGSQGRRQVQDEYIQSMLDSKVIVVAQRDGWEDHYRIWEALVSGALVLTDPMLALSQYKHAFRNGTHWIVYESLTQLTELVKYYLQHESERNRIAQAGMEHALQYHRSWHRVEEMVFG